MSETTPLNEVEMQEYLRTRGRNTPNKTQEAAAAGIGYGSFMHFLNNPGVMLSTGNLQKLMRHYGLELVVAGEMPPLVPTPSTWLVHPQNAVYEYEIGADRKPTGKVRKIEVAQSMAAE